MIHYKITIESLLNGSFAQDNDAQHFLAKFLNALTKPQYTIKVDQAYEPFSDGRQISFDQQVVIRPQQHPCGDFIDLFYLDSQDKEQRVLRVLRRAELKIFFPVIEYDYNNSQIKDSLSCIYQYMEDKRLSIMPAGLLFTAGLNQQKYHFRLPFSLVHFAGAYCAIAENKFAQGGYGQINEILGIVQLVANQNGQIAVNMQKTEQALIAKIFNQKTNQQTVQHEGMILNNVPYLRPVFIMNEQCNRIIVMPKVPGKNFIDTISKLKNFSDEKKQELKFKYVKNLINALKEVHSLGIVHRDVKPDNMIYDEETQTIKLVDFGFAEIIQKHIFQKRKHIKGTLGYLSSVVLQRFDNKQTLQLDFQADIASLAMCIYTVLAEWSPTISRQKNTPLLQQRQEYIVQAQQVIHKKFTDNNFTNGIIRILDAVLADKPYTLEQLDRDYHALLQKVAPALADELYPLQNKENVQQAAPVSPMKSRRVPILGMPHNRFFALPALPPAEIRKRTANEALQDASPKRRTCQA